MSTYAGYFKRYKQEMDGNFKCTTAAALGGAAVGAGTMYAYLSRRYGRQLRELHREMDEEAALHSTEWNSQQKRQRNESKPVRIYIDGCFDMMHYGHSNALRQARSVGDVLVVGVHSDEEIIRAKGAPPVIPEDERYLTVEACKFVDEIIKDAPYVPSVEWIDKLVNEHQIDYIVHGDDPCYTVDGRDAYAYAKEKGIFKIIKRTEGVSTTDIVGRMLLMTRDHHLRTGSETCVPTRPPSSANQGSESSIQETVKSLEHEQAKCSRFLPTARRIRQFSNGRAPSKDDTVVYICGSWDLFNSGHIKALEKARKYGTFLIAGIYSDEVSNKLRGSGHPILNLHERTLSVLSCQYVDEVIMDAPWRIERDMLQSMNISVVARGTVCDYRALSQSPDKGHTESPKDINSLIEDSYSVPRELGILREFKSPSSLTVADIVSRVLQHRETYEKRCAKKSSQEANYYGTEKQFVAEQ
eukprot:gb/GECG01006624.1/.p1 GENE.gb/GECG01006624.1/~~gb/GECG01006624.1/.p1  ORF type:complete len:470 (+),score=67.09 gb/GECG01006624.1/:1-1410(+)